MSLARPEAVERVVAAAAAKGLRIEIRETAGSRSAEEAAAAVGTSLARIVKSLVFRGTQTDAAYLLLVSGATRVDEAAMAPLLGEPIGRPDADFVRRRTGFAIGGVSPFGSTGPLTVFMDEALLAFPTVWAAAGTPRHVFEAVPLQLLSALGAKVGRVA